MSREAAEWLYRTIVPDLDDRPVHVGLTSELPPEFDCQSIVGVTSPDLDLSPRKHLPNWKGRGPAVLINDLQVQRSAEQNRHIFEKLEIDVDEYVQRRLWGIALHEIGHRLPFHEIEQPIPETEVVESVQRTAEYFRTRDDTPEEELTVPQFFSHDGPFYRNVAHLHYRAKAAGLDLPISYVAVEAEAYVEALRDEPVELERWTFTDIARITPPVAFVTLWRSKMVGWLKSQPIEVRQRSVGAIAEAEWW